MTLPAGWYRPFLILLFLLALAPGAAGFTVQNVAITPSSEPIAPGTPVRVTYTVHMDSWITGTTFPSSSTLDMYTELGNPFWDVTMKLEDEQDVPPVVSNVLQRSSVRARIDGWTLSYSSARIDLDVVLTGVAPDVGTAQEKVIFRVQEIDAGANTVSGTTTTRKYLIAVPTTPPTPTPAPTTEVTTVPTTETPPPTPTVKKTYAPGPEPLAICGALGALAIAVAWGRKR